MIDFLQQLFSQTQARVSVFVVHKTVHKKFSISQFYIAFCCGGDIIESSKGKEKGPRNDR